MPIVPSARELALFTARLMDRILSILPSIGNFQPVRGYFSAELAVQQNDLEGEFIHREQESGACTPGSITELSKHNQHNHQPWPIFWARDNEARLVGRMLEWRDRNNRICSEGLFKTSSRRRMREDKIFAQTWITNPKQLDGAWTSIVSNWGNGDNYYHWLCDSLTRLYVWEQLPEKTRILIPNNAPRHVRETIKLLNIEKDCLPAPSYHIAPERFYFCSPTAMTGAWNPIGFNWLRSKFKSLKGTNPNSPPLFLTRRNTSRIPDNLEEIESIMIDNGFKIIDCGDYSVQEQICMLSSAPAVAGLHGAALTNFLWVKPGTPVLEIFEAGYLNACFEQIANQGKLDYQFVINQNGDTSIIRDWAKRASP